MELCCPQRAAPTIPHHDRSPSPFIIPTASLSLQLRPATTLSSGNAPVPRSKACIAGGRFFPSPGMGMGMSKRNPSLIPLSFSDDTSTVVSEPLETATDVTAPDSVKEHPYKATSTEEAPVSGGEEQSGLADFLNNLDLKLDSGDTYNILIYGSGALVALWITSAIVGALDSLPLFPKVMELIGLGFTVWFSTRFLIFKSNRDELFAQFESLKEQIFGPAND